MSGYTSSVTSGETQPPQVQPEVTQPRASTEAVNFLQGIVPEVDFKYLMFEDHLVTTSDTGKELGEFKVTIEPVKHKGQECFLVHANSHGAIDGVPCGTSITAYVGNNLETLDQQHHEYVKLENCPLDRKTFIVKQEEDYVINRVISQGEDIQRSSKVVKAEQMQGFISEGSNLLLHRLFIEKGIPASLQMISFDSDTNLCPAIYRRLEDRTQTVEKTELKVYGIERTINSSIDLPTTWQSYFMEDGHLTNRVQVGSPVTMKLSFVPALIIRDEEPPKPTFEKQPLKWEEDAQLYSQFLDRKVLGRLVNTDKMASMTYFGVKRRKNEGQLLSCKGQGKPWDELKADHAKYMSHHPELRALLADFMQFLLLRKPDDVIAFAAEYFSAFSTSMPSPSPYLASNSVTPFPNSRTNTKIEQLRAPTR